MIWEVLRPSVETTRRNRLHIGPPLTPGRIEIAPVSPEPRLVSCRLNRSGVSEALRNPGAIH